VPLVDGHRFFAAEGGVISYGTDVAQSFAQAASYIDRILKGKTPATCHYSLLLGTIWSSIIKTAKAIGLDVPVNVLALADEVID
jgi:putative tryptophan/tyrosine transport system substrate-binding protein